MRLVRRMGKAGRGYLLHTVIPVSYTHLHITAEACVAHLLFTLSDYRTLGTRIKCNPAIKKQADRDALRAAVNSGLIDVIATDHAPHLLSEKEGGALKAMSGMPMIQFSLMFPFLTILPQECNPFCINIE